MEKYNYKHKISETPRDDTSFSSCNENARKERRVTEESFRVERLRRGNSNTFKPLSKNNKRKKERIYKHSSISLVPSDLSIDSCILIPNKTKVKVNRKDKINNSTFRSTDQFKKGSNPHFELARNANGKRNTNTFSDYFFVVPISEIGFREANVKVIKRLKHMQKLNHRQQLAKNEIKIPPTSFTPEEGSKTLVNGIEPRKIKYKDKVRPEKSFPKDKISNKQKLLNTNMKIAKISLDDKEERDMDSFNNLKQNLVEFVSNTFLYTERKHNEQNQNNSVKESNGAVPPKGTLMHSNKIIYQSRKHRRKGSESYTTHKHSFSQEAFSEYKNSDNVKGGCVFPNSLKKSFTKNQHAFAEQRFQNDSKKDYDLESELSILTNYKLVNGKNNNLKISNMTNSKKKTTNDDFKQDCDSFESDVVILNASDSQFVKISDFLKIKSSHSNSKRELKGKAFYKSEKRYKENNFPRVQKVQSSNRLQKKVTNNKLKPVCFPLDSLRDVLVYSGKIEASTIKRLKKQLDNNSGVSNLTSRIIKDKVSYQEQNVNNTTECLSKHLDDNSGVSNLTHRIISDKNCYQEFNPSTMTHLGKQLDDNFGVNDLKCGIINDKYFYKELNNYSNVKGLRTELNHHPPLFSCYDMKVEHDSSEHAMIPELDRPPSQNLKRKQSCTEEYDKNLSNNATKHLESDLKIKCSKKSTKSLNETLRRKQSEYLGLDLLSQGVSNEQSSDTLEKYVGNADKVVSDKRLSAANCTLNEIEVNNTNYSRFRISLKDSSPPAKTTASQSHQKETYHYNNHPKSQDFIKNNQRSKDSKISVSIAIQTDLQLINELEKENEYLKNTKGTFTNDLYEHIYINKHVRSQIEKARPTCVQNGELSLMEVISNNIQTCSDTTFKKTSNISIQSESSIQNLVPVPIISEPDDFFDNFISSKNQRIFFSDRIDEPNYASEIHNDDWKYYVRSSQYHLKSSHRAPLLNNDSEKQINSKPLKEFINTNLEHEISNGFNNQTKISTQENSYIKTSKYSKSEVKSIRCKEGQFSDNERQTILDSNDILNKNLMDLKKSQIITRFITENMNNETNNIKNVTSPPQSDTFSKEYNQCSDLDKTRISKNNGGMELPVTVQEGRRMDEYNEEMKTKHLEHQLLVDIDSNLPYQSIKKLSNSGLLSCGKNNNLSTSNLLPKYKDRNNEGKTNLSAGTLLGENMDRKNEGMEFLTSLHSTDIIDKNHEDSEMPPLALHSLVEIDKNPTYQIAGKSNSAELLSLDRNTNLSNILLLVKSPDRHNEGITSYKSLHSTNRVGENNEEIQIKIPNLLEKDKNLSTSILLEKNRGTDMTKLHLIEELSKGSSQSICLEETSNINKPIQLTTNEQTSNISITTSIHTFELIEPSYGEREEQSKIDNCELIKAKSQHEKTAENGNNYKRTKKQSVQYIFEKVPFKYNNKSISDASISLEQPDLKLSRSNLSSFDHILLNISIRDKGTTKMLENKNHYSIPFKKSLILMPINHRDNDDYKRPKDNDLKNIEQFESNARSFNKVCVATPTNKEIKCSLDYKTPSLCSRNGSKTNSETAKENIATVSSNNSLNANCYASGGHEMELCQINAKVKATQVRSNNSSEPDSRTSNTANISIKTSQSDKLETSKKITKMNSKRKLNRIFLCNYITYVPFINIISKLGGINILTVNKGQQFQLYTRLVKCYTKNHLIDVVSINYSLSQLKNHCFKKQKIFI